ncbi:MAG: ribbon-helix-helix protein, CopG family [Spirochaetales bacterium]|nr:ribbon-helix-helix protein, CopG family [Spirochaetales bacterium]
MKTFQISLDNNIMTFIEKIIEEQQKTRSAVIREAISYWIKHITIDEFEAQWIRALKKEDNQNYVDDTEAWIAAEQWEES